MNPGARVHPNKFGRLRLSEDTYGQDLHARWWIRPAGAGTRGVLLQDVLEHADATITVSGFLAGGLWVNRRSA